MAGPGSRPGRSFAVGGVHQHQRVGILPGLRQRRGDRFDGWAPESPNLRSVGSPARSRPSARGKWDPAGSSGCSAVISEIGVGCRAQGLVPGVILGNSQSVGFHGRPLVFTVSRNTANRSRFCGQVRPASWGARPVLGEARNADRTGCWTLDSGSTDNIRRHRKGSGQPGTRIS